MRYQRRRYRHARQRQCRSRTADIWWGIKGEDLYYYQPRIQFIAKWRIRGGQQSRRRQARRLEYQKTVRPQQRGSDSGNYAGKHFATTNVGYTVYQTINNLS